MARMYLVWLADTKADIKNGNMVALAVKSAEDLDEKMRKVGKRWAVAVRSDNMTLKDAAEEPVARFNKTKNEVWYYARAWFLFNTKPENLADGLYCDY